MFYILEICDVFFNGIVYRSNREEKFYLLLIILVRFKWFVVYVLFGWSIVFYFFFIRS